MPPDPHARPSASSATPPTQGARADEIATIFREHNDALLRFIAAKLGSKQEASEVAQEAYIRLLSLDSSEAISYLRAFLFKTAANLATDRLRRRSRRERLLSASGIERAVFELSPERQLEGEQTIARMREAIDELPQKCREAFLLYRLEELSCEQIAARLGLQQRMVWRYIARALEYIRLRLAEASEQAGSSKEGGRA